MRTLLRVLLLLSALLSAVVMLACGPSRSGGGGGGGAELGESCDGEEGEETCDGSVALECKTQEDGSFVWEGEDCRDSGERCVRGECVEPEENNSANSAGSCPDRAGSWSFEEHCDPSLVGTEYVITQAGCELTVASVGWTGSVDAEGVVTIGGPVPGGELTCVGPSTEDRLEASCVPTCDVVLVR